MYKKENVIKKVGRWIKGDSSKYMDDAENSSTVLTTDQQKAQEIREFNNNAITNFQNWYERAADNIGLVYDEHWSKKDKAKHEEQDRSALNMPGIFAKVLNLSGFEKNNRLQFEADPVGKEDELLAEIFNVEFRHIENQDDPKKYKYTKSDLFFDGIVPLFGASEVYTETDEIGENEIKIRDIPFNELVFERNFTDVEMTACNRIQHFYEVNKEQLKFDYPDKKDDIDKIPQELLRIVPKYTEPDYITNQSSSINPDQKYVTKIRDYHRITKDVYQVWLIKEDQIEEYLDKKEAEERLKELQQQIDNTPRPTDTPLKRGINQPQGSSGEVSSSGEMDSSENYILKTVPKRVWEYTVVAGDVVLDGPKVLEVSDECPITLYFSIFVRGKILTIVDIVRHLQQYYDKIFSQMDYDIGTDTKVTKVLHTQLVDEDNQTIDEALDAVAEGGVVLSKGLEGNPVEIVKRSGTNRDYADIFKLLMDMMDDTFGGQYFLGATSQDMSGKAIGKMQAAATLIAINYMDNLGRYDAKVGQKLIKYIKKFYTSKHTRKVLGENLSDEIKQLMIDNKIYDQSTLHSGIGWVLVNDPNIPESMLSDANLNIILNSVNVRQDEKDVEYQKLLGLKQQGYAVPVEAILDTLNLKVTLKNKIVVENEKQEAMRERAMALQEKQAEFNANLQASKAAHEQMNAPSTTNPGQQQQQ